MCPKFATDSANFSLRSQLLPFRYTLRDADLRVVARSTNGRLDLSVPAGTYQLESESPVDEPVVELIQLTGGETYWHVGTVESVADVPINRRNNCWKSYQREVEHEISRKGLLRPKSGLALVLDGDIEGNPYFDNAWRHSIPFTLLDAARQRESRLEAGWRVWPEAGTALSFLRARPGIYTLQTRTNPGRVAEQIVMLAKGWLTTIVIPKRSDGILLPSLATVSMRSLTGLGNRWAELSVLSDTLYGLVRSGHAERELCASEDLRQLLLTDPLTALMVLHHFPDSDSEVVLAAAKGIQPLIEEFPNLPDLQHFTNRMANAGRRSTNPPLFATTPSGSQAPSQDPEAGSYGEHAMSAATNSGIWAVWPSPETLPDRPHSGNNDIARAEGWMAMGIDRLTKRTRGARYAVILLAIFLVIARLLHSRWAALSISERMASIKTQQLQRIAVTKVLAHASLVARLRHRTTAMALAGMDFRALADSAGVSTRVAGQLQGAVAARLGGNMSTGVTNKTARAGAPSAEAEKQGLSIPARWAALVVLVGFGGLVIWMMMSTNEPPDQWQRRVYVFGSVEALVFAAAGALFGVEVKRREVARATDQVRDAREEADEARQSEQVASERAQAGTIVAATGRAIVEQAIHDANVSVPRGPDVPPGPDVPRGADAPSAQLSTVPAASLKALLTVIDELYPPGS